MRTGKTIIATALCCAGAVCGLAHGQQEGRADNEPTAPTPEEEVVVRGTSPAALRLQIRLAEEAVYERFNELNSDDEFDIHCRLDTFTGSRMLHRVCQPNFQRTAQENAGRETVIGLQGGPSFGAQQFAGEAHLKQQALAEEMRRLAREDEELLQALTRIVRLEQRLDERRESGGASFSAGTRQLTATSEESLPYGAARMAEARVGEAPWRHRLNLRTFTIAQVYGEIDTVEVQCGRQTEALAYEAGVEWTLPEDWGACELLVEAPMGTTFSLLEFESAE